MSDFRDSCYYTLFLHERNQKPFELSEASSTAAAWMTRASEERED